MPVSLRNTRPSRYILLRDNLGVRAWFRTQWIRWKIAQGYRVSLAEAVEFLGNMFNGIEVALYLYRRGNRGVVAVPETCILARFFQEVTGDETIFVGRDAVFAAVNNRVETRIDLPEGVSDLRRWFDTGELPDLENH